MKLIALTSAIDRKTILINPEHIGHIYENDEFIDDRGNLKEGSVVGVTTHDNGGFFVNETPEEIKGIIKKTFPI